MVARGEGCLGYPRPYKWGLATLIITTVPRFGVLPQRTPPTIIFIGEGPYTGPHFQWQSE